MRKVSAYLAEQESARLEELAQSEGRSRAEIVREAIAAYVPAGKGQGEFALAAGFEPIDEHPRPMSDIPDNELLDEFGQ